MSPETLGVMAASLGSVFGGIAGGTTRFVIAATDPVTLGVLRYGIGFLLLSPVAIFMKSRWPAWRDWPAVIALGLMFFLAFSVLFNLAYSYTTAARGALTLSTMPVMTMTVAAVLGVERLTWRKTLGVLIAFGGVAVALFTGLHDAPAGAWRGEVVMAIATFLMSLYNVWSRPYIARSDPLAFVTVGMGATGLVLLVWALLIGGFAKTADFGWPQWAAVAYLSVIGASFIFFLWAFALGRAGPTRTAVTMTINPVMASIFGALAIGEPIGLNLVIGLVAVAAGIVLTTFGGPVKRVGPASQAR